MCLTEITFDSVKKDRQRNINTIKNQINSKLKVIHFIIILFFCFCHFGCSIIYSPAFARQFTVVIAHIVKKNRHRNGPLNVIHIVAYFVCHCFTFSCKIFRYLVIFKGSFTVTARILSSFQYYYYYQVLHTSISLWL